MIFSPAQQKNPILEFGKFLRGELHWLSFCVSLILKLAVILTVVVVLLVPIPVYANGGAPLLLIFFNMDIFLNSVLLIIAVEWMIYVWWARIPALEAFWDALTVNLVSTLLVSSVPLLVDVVFIILDIVLPRSTGEFAMAFETWIREGQPFPKVMWTSIVLVFWWIVTFVLTVQIEKAFLEIIWKAHPYYESQLSASTLSWISNTVTYLGLIGLFIGGSQLFGNK